MGHIHSQGFVHRDIKAENILISSCDDEDLVVKLCDFGFCAKSFEEGRPLTDLVGSPYYIAPEVLQKGYNHKCDMWSLGVVFYHLLSKSFPYIGEHNAQILEKIKSKPILLDGPEWENVSEEAKSLLKRMLTKNPVIRIDVSEALDHPWFKKTLRHKTDPLLQLRPNIVRNLASHNTFEQVALHQIGLNKQDPMICDVRRAFYSLDKAHSGEIPSTDLLKNLELASSLVNQNNLLWNKESLSFSQFAALSLDYRQVICKKENQWAAFRLLKDPRDGKITRDSLSKILSLHFRNLSED